jgi:hypothetical protein
LFERAIDIGHPGDRTLSMLAPQCLFCDHINPAAAKFCNECGEPLHLKSCKQCEAINDRTARICYRCGAADPAFDIAPEAIAATSWGEPRETTPVVAAQTPDAGTGRRPKHRPAALTSLVLLGALAASAYYAYSHPTQVKGWLGAARSTVGGTSGDAAMPSVPATSGMPAPPATSVSEGAASIDASRLATPTAANTPVNDVTTAPARQDSVPATGIASVDGQTPPPNQTQAASLSQPPASTPAQAPPTPQATRMEKKPSVGSKASAKRAKKSPPKKVPVPSKTMPPAKASAKPVEVPKTATGT